VIVAGAGPIVGRLLMQQALRLRVVKPDHPSTSAHYVVSAQATSLTLDGLNPWY
jgi:hypothetical protein